MATLRNKRKLAAASRGTPESTRNNRGQNTLDPDLTQVSQISEEIEGRVTMKFSRECSRKESRILGALSRLDEFLLLKSTSSDLFRSCSGNIQEQQFRKPGNHCKSFLRRSLPQSEVLFSPLWSN